MKRLLLAGVAVLSAWAVPARAQIPGLGSIPGLGGLGGGAGGITCSNCYTQLSGTTNAATEILKMIAQIEQLIQIFTMLSGNTSVNSMAAVLNSAAVFNQMGSFGNVPVMIQGGAVGSMGASYLAANTIFMPGASNMPYMNTVALIEQRQATSLANLQGMATSMLITSNTILVGLMQLQRLIDAQPSNQLMAGVNSRMSAYNGNIQTQQYQLAQMQAMANAQRQVYEQQRRQAGFCSSVSWYNDRQYYYGAGPTVSGSGTGCVGGGGLVAGGFGASPGSIAGGGIVLASASPNGIGGLGSLGTVGLVGGAGVLSLGSGGATSFVQGGQPIAGFVQGGQPIAGFVTNDQGPLAGFISQPDTSGTAGATANVSPTLPTPPTPPTGTVDATVSDGGCVEVSDGSDCGGLTMDDTANFDPTAPISAIPPTGPGIGDAVTILPGGDPTSSGISTDFVTFNDLPMPKPTDMAGMAVVALLKPRRRKDEQLRMAA
jgi:Type IV secretion system proteins